MGVMVEPSRGTRISRMALRMASARDWPASRCITMFSTTTMASSITSPTAAARPPSVIRLNVWSSMRRMMNVTPMVAGITRPATREVPQSRRNSTMIKDARISPIRMASRTLSMESLTISDWSYQGWRWTLAGSVFADLLDFGVNPVGHRHRIAVRLAEDVEQHGGLGVGGHHRVYRHHRWRDGGDVANVNGRAGGRGLDDDVRDFVGSARLPAHQAQHQLVAHFDQARRIDHVAAADGVQDIGDGDGGLNQLAGIRLDLKLGLLPALHHHRGQRR